MNDFAFPLHGGRVDDLHKETWARIQGLETALCDIADILAEVAPDAVLAKRRQARLRYQDAKPDHPELQAWENRIVRLYAAQRLFVLEAREDRTRLRPEPDETPTTD